MNWTDAMQAPLQLTSSFNWAVAERFAGDPTAVEDRPDDSGKAAGRPPGDRPSNGAATTCLVSVHFNMIATDHIRDAKRPLYLDNTLQTILNSNRNAARIPEFPTGSIAVKAVWWPLKYASQTENSAQQVSIIPVWNGRVAATDCGIGNTMCLYGNDFARWADKVGVDRAEFAGAPYKAQVKAIPDWRWTNKATDPGMLEVFPRDAIYDRPVVVTDPKTMAVFKQVWFELPETNDRWALVALHVAVKRQEDWLWITLWWHDRPNDGKFACEREKVKFADKRWTHYRMDVVDGADRSDAQKRPVFSPWLEAPLANGIVSNCVICHRHATWTRTDIPSVLHASERVSLTFPPEDWFKGKVALDDLWSLAPLNKSPCGR